MEVKVEVLEDLKPCGKFIYHHSGKGNVHCQEARLCKKCEERIYRVYVGRPKTASNGSGNK